MPPRLLRARPRHSRRHRVIAQDHSRTLAQSTGVSLEHGDADSSERRAESAAPPARLARQRDGTRINGITTRRILYWLAAAVSVLAVGTIIGLIWADTSDAAGLFAVVTNIVGAAGIVVLLIALAVVTRRQRHLH